MVNHFLVVCGPRCQNRGSKLAKVTEDVNIVQFRDFSGGQAEKYPRIVVSTKSEGNHKPGWSTCLVFNCVRTPVLKSSSISRNNDRENEQCPVKRHKNASRFQFSIRSGTNAFSIRAVRVKGPRWIKRAHPSRPPRFGPSLISMRRLRHTHPLGLPVALS